MKLKDCGDCHGRGKRPPPPHVFDMDCLFREPGYEETCQVCKGSGKVEDDSHRYPYDSNGNPNPDYKPEL